MQLGPGVAVRRLLQLPHDAKRVCVVLGALAACTGSGQGCISAEAAGIQDTKFLLALCSL